MAMRMHTHYMGLAGPSLRFAIGLSAGLCFIAFGYGQGDIGGMMVMQSFRTKFYQFDTIDNPNIHTASLAGVVIASWNLGCFLGAFLTIFLGDRLGRKGTVILGLVLETIGKIIQTTSFGLGQYVAGRVIAGVGNGFIAATVPAWQAETLKIHKRGTLLLVSFGTCMTFGIAIAYWIVYAFSFTQPSSASWRAPVILVTLVTLPALVIMSFMPESPRWLLLKAREGEAIRVLSALHELPEDHEDIRREVLQIKNAVKHMASTPTNLVFQQGEYRYRQRAILAILLQVMQQWTGVNLFIQYLGAMFANELHFPTREAMFLAACCSLEFFAASLVAVIGIDRFWSRRQLTMFGAGGMCLCMILLCVFNYVGTYHHTWAFHVMAAVLFLYNTFFSVGWQGMSWMWAVELIPLSVRGPVNAMSTAANWLSNFIVVIVTPFLFVRIGYQTYIVFAVTNFAIVPMIYFFFPETGSRSLEEVDMVFKAATQYGNPWLSVVKAARDEPRWFDKNGDPTDSYGGSDSAETEKGDSDLKSTADGDYESPDPLYREPDEEAWALRGPAPSPSVARTHSNARTASRG